MELLLKNKDYVPDGAGGFASVAGAEEVLQRVLWRLTARRGAFPFLPELGSKLYLVMREKPCARESLAQQYVAEALAEETDLTVTAVALTQDGDTAALTVALEWQGETLSVELTL